MSAPPSCASILQITRHVSWIRPLFPYSLICWLVSHTAKAEGDEGGWWGPPLRLGWLSFFSAGWRGWLAVSWTHDDDPCACLLAIGWLSSRPLELYVYRWLGLACVVIVLLLPLLHRSTTAAGKRSYGGVAMRVATLHLVNPTSQHGNPIKWSGQNTTHGLLMATRRHQPG